MFSVHSRSPYFEQLRTKITDLGGMFNAHLHLDRAGTFDDKYFETAQLTLSDTDHISLHRKHALIANIHSGPGYEPGDLERRLRSVLETMIDLGTRRADTMVDVTADRVQLNALKLMLRLREEYSDRIDLRAASYTPLGFNDDRPEQWELYEEGAKIANFLGALPEADDRVDYPENIGFMEHCRRVLELSKEHGKMVHFHTDQRNDPRESGTEQVIEAVRRYGGPECSREEPLLWVIHMVSPSTYEEPRFEALVEGLLECNIGLICCPSAAVGMRQLRPLNTPTYNSIPRVLELLAAGVKVRIASDNIADICSPSTTADLADELFVLSAALRFYNTDILARLAAGVDVTEEQRKLIREHLVGNEEGIERALATYHV